MCQSKTGLRCARRRPHPRLGVTVHASFDFDPRTIGLPQESGAVASAGVPAEQQLVPRKNMTYTNRAAHIVASSDESWYPQV